MKTYCGRVFDGSDPLNPNDHRSCGERRDLGSDVFQCPECKEKDEIPPDPTPFEVLNAQNISLLRHKNVVINLNQVVMIEKHKNTLIISGTGDRTQLLFNDPEEAQAAFDAITGKITPINKELKDHQTRNKAIEQSQAIDL